MKKIRKNQKGSQKVFHLAFVISLLLSGNLQGQDNQKTTFIGYGDASYSGLSENEFVKNWLILEPVKIGNSGSNPGNDEQKAAFDKEQFKEVKIFHNKPVSKIKIDKTEYSWQLVKSDNEVIDFTKVFGQVDYAIAYAVAEIKMDAPMKVLIGVGSDDGIKIFLNGELVHTNWIARGVKPDDDLVELNLNKGSNQLLIKVQNIDMGWGFVIHRPGKDQLPNLFVESAGNGNLNQVKMLLNSGIGINSTNEAGLTAYQYSRIRGNEELISFLKEKGAKTDLPLPGLEKFISNLFKNVRKGPMPGASVLVAQNGEIIYQNGFGYADIEKKIPVTPDTKFKIGSISKQFTAAAILKLQEEGKICVDEKLSKYIPDFPRGNEVTIYQLLTHTSGIHSYEYHPGFYMHEPITPKALIDTIKTFSYDFNPGERYQYNNSGYFILGYLVAQISGKTLGGYLNETFFKPLGMKKTGIYETNIVLNNEAQGYSMDGEVVKKADFQEMSWALGVGSIYSTTKDLFKWNEAIFNGKILSEASLKAAFAPAVLKNNIKVDYGYGWFLSTNRGLKFIQHSGGVSGFSAYLERQPDNKLTVCVLCNSLPTPNGIHPITNSQSISEFILWDKMEKLKTFATDTNVSVNLLNQYVGRYNIGQGRIMFITLENKQLFGSLTGQPKDLLSVYSANEFYFKALDATINFVPDSAGIVEHLILRNNGQSWDAKKIKDETPVKVNPDIFDKLTGKYDLGNNYIVEIVKENNKLYGLAPNLPKFEFLPAGELEYFMMEATSRTLFILNNEGKAESIIVIIDGMNMPGKRIGN